MLFQQEQPQDQSPIEDINITSIYLFYDDAQARKFKEQCKRGMIKMWPTTYQSKNISEFLFNLTQQYNAD